MYVLQLGIQAMTGSSAGDFVDSPQEVVLPPRSNGDPSLVSTIACGANHNLALLKNGKEVSILNLSYFYMCSVTGLIGYSLCLSTGFFMGIWRYACIGSR